jgi:pyocin large subunit-like protein
MVVDGKAKPNPLKKPGIPVVAKPAPAPLPKSPPTGLIWGNVDSLQDHFNRHGPDFRASSPDDYAAKAWLFLQRAKRDGLPMKWDDTDQTLRVWEGATRTFAAYDRRGKARTFFKPSNPEYWNRQPGRLVKPAELSF